MNICAECKWWRQGTEEIPDVCIHPGALRRDCVTGRSSGVACYKRRYAQLTDDCPDWTPRPAPWWRLIWRKEANL